MESIAGADAEANEKRSSGGPASAIKPHKNTTSTVEFGRTSCNVSGGAPEKVQTVSRACGAAASAAATI